MIMVFKNINLFA